MPCPGTYCQTSSEPSKVTRWPLASSGSADHHSGLRCSVRNSGYRRDGAQLAARGDPLDGRERARELRLARAGEALDAALDVGVDRAVRVVGGLVDRARRRRACSARARSSSSSRRRRQGRSRRARTCTQQRNAQTTEVFVSRPWSDARLAMPACHPLQHSLRPSVSPSQELLADDPLSPCSAALAARGARAVVAACGGDDSSGGEEASASTDVNELLKQTFTGAKKVESGNLDLTLKIEAEGGDVAAPGPGQLSLEGPVPDAGRRQAAEVRARRRLRGRRPEHHARARRRPATRATSPSRAPTTWSTTRSSSSSRPASSRRRSRARRATSRASPRSAWTRASG